MYAFGHDPQASYLTITFTALLISGSEYRGSGGGGGGFSRFGRANTYYTDSPSGEGWYTGWPSSGLNDVAGYSSGYAGGSGGGGAGGMRNNVVSMLTSQYASGRVSQTQAKAQVTLGGSSNVFQGYITGMQTNTMDAERNLQSFSITLAIPECQI